MDTAEFLSRFAPFAGLEEARRTAIAAVAEEHRHEPGDVLLLEDGTPSNHLFVVREGSVELVHQGEVVDVLGTGESFGHPSLLSGLAPAFTVRARERTVCILIPREAAIAVFTDPAGAGYLATSIRHRMVQAGHVVHALPELGTIRVAELISRPPIFCEGAVTIRRAAQLMTDNDTSAILVRDGSNLSILTDAVLRERVVAGGMPARTPLSLIVRPAVHVGPAWLALGSTARREFTLGSDQENALAYDGEAEEVDAYFAGLGEDVTRGLVRCGFELDPNDVVASNGLWRLPARRWSEVFRECLET